MTTIKEIKAKYNLENKDIADLFGLSLGSYDASSAKKRYVKALEGFYKLINDRQILEASKAHKRRRGKRIKKAPTKRARAKK